MQAAKIECNREYQFFATPPALAKRMVEMAWLTAPNMSVLEPSAGQGAIVDAILQHGKYRQDIFVVEHMIDNQLVLSNKYAHSPEVFIMNPLNDDFLQLYGNARFDRIIANPPFSKGQDVDHIMKMWEVLAEGGRMITISSPHWQYLDDKKSKQFQDFINNVEAEIEILEPGTFKESGTGVMALLISINNLHK